VDPFADAAGKKSNGAKTMFARLLKFLFGLPMDGGLSKRARTIRRNQAPWLHWLFLILGAVPLAMARCENSSIGTVVSPNEVTTPAIFAILQTTSPLVAAALCIKPRPLLTARQAEEIDALKRDSPDFAAMRSLAMKFRGVLRRLFQQPGLLNKGSEQHSWVRSWQSAIVSSAG
jgi:hypothetical protein